MEAKGSDVQSAQDIPPMTDEEKRKHAELSEKLRLLFQECSEFRPNEMSVYWGLFAHRVNKMLIVPVIEARVQAAAVEMRERCARYVESCRDERNDVVQVFDVMARHIANLPIPTSALDAMLLKARIDEVRQWLMSEGLDKAIGKGETRGWRCKRLAEMERQLAALTQPAQHAMTCSKQENGFQCTCGAETQPAPDPLVEESR